VPIWQDGRKRGIADGCFLPPVTFTQAEAVSVFLAARMMQHFSPQHNSSVASTFMKLNTIVPSFLQHQIRNTIAHLEMIPEEAPKINNFDRLIQAWLSRRPVTVHYLELYGENPIEYTIEPYFIEPVARNRSNYVIAYCRATDSIKTFKMDRIIGDARIESSQYEIPANFNIDDYLSSAWGAYADGRVQKVKLLFSPRISRAIMQTKFHYSQSVVRQKNGSLVMNLTIRNTGDFRAWILGWGKDVEVIGPQVLRSQIARDIQSLAIRYGVHDTASRHWKSVRLKSSMHDITDEQWQRITPLLPPQPKTGRPRANDRKVINGILWVLQNNAKWNSIPRRYGACSTCYTRLQKWCERGVWERIREAMAASS
jgi:predicted DNA-binding transcriptional regulator YafY